MQAASHEEEQPKSKRRGGRNAIRMDKYEDETDMPELPPGLPAPTSAVVVSPTAKRKPIKLQEEEAEEEDLLDEKPPFGDEDEDEARAMDEDAADEDDFEEDDDETEVDEESDEDEEETEGEEVDEDEVDEDELDEEIEEAPPVTAKRKPRDKPDDRRPPDPTPHTPRRGNKTRTA